MIKTVIDLEGTSINIKECFPLSVSYLSFVGDLTNIVGADTLFFYKDGIRWSKEAEEIHHLSQDFLSQFRGDYIENCRKLFKVLKKSNLIGQNIKHFDLPILDNFLGKEGYIDLSVQSVTDTMYVLGKKKKLQVIAETLEIDSELISSLTKSFFAHTPLKGEGIWHSSEFDVVATALIHLVKQT